jgi:hypothetical protein
LKIQISMFIRNEEHNGVIMHGEIADIVVPVVGDFVRTTAFDGKVVERYLTFEPGPALKVVVKLDRVAGEAIPVS